MGLGVLTDVGKQQTISLDRYNDLITTEAKYRMMVRYLQDPKSNLSRPSVLQLLGEEYKDEQSGSKEITEAGAEKD
jgi:hypothetical protein